MKQPETCPLLLLVLLHGGCAGSGVRPQALDVEVPMRVGYAVASDWSRNITPLVSPTAVPVAFGSGHGVVTLAQRNPCRRVILQAGDTTQLFSRRVCPPDGADTFPRPQPGPIVDVVYVAPRGVPWYLDHGRRLVLWENVSAGRGVIARLRARGNVSSACSTDGQWIVYLDSLQPGILLFQEIDGREPLRVVIHDEEFAALSAERWEGLQLRGAPGAPCILFGHHMRRFAIVWNDSLIRTADLHEPVSFMPARWRPGSTRWWPFPRPGSPVPGALDVASHGDGIAVLHHGATGLGGRLIDLYDHSGRYRETMILPDRATRITALYQRLLVLSEREEAWWLSAYPLPGASATIDLGEDIRIEDPRPGEAR